jgi:hypothetical protein
VKPFVGWCFGRMMSKVCQYPINDTNLCVGMKEVLLKDAQATLQKTSTWINKSNNGKKHWDKVYIVVGFAS